MAVGLIDINDEFKCYSIKFERKGNTNKEVFTSLIRVKGSDYYHVVPVKTTEEIEINKFIEVSKAISRIYVSLPIKVGEVICNNILNTGINIVATKTILEK